MKATIVFEDNPDNSQSVKAVFDPPLGKGGSTTSRAQYMALQFMSVMVDSGAADLDGIDGDEA